METVSYTHLDVYKRQVRDEYIFGEYVTGKDDIRKGNRQSIQSLIDVCLESMVDAVLIWEVSRLSRNFIYGVTTIDKFNRDYKIPIYFRDKRKWTIDIETGKIDIWLLNVYVI